MSEKKHGPVPWKVETEVCETGPGYPVCDAAGKRVGISVFHFIGEESDSPAVIRMLACVNALEGFADPSAAKDLLEALELAEQYLPTAAEISYSPNRYNPEVETECAKVRAVLSCARGETK